MGPYGIAGPGHDNLADRPYLDIVIINTKKFPVDLLGIHFRAGAIGKAAAFVQVALIEFDNAAMPRAYVRTQRYTGPAGRAESIGKDFLFQSLKAFHHSKSLYISCVLIPPEAD